MADKMLDSLGEPAYERIRSEIAALARDPRKKSEYGQESRDTMPMDRIKRLRIRYEAKEKGGEGYADRAVERWGQLRDFRLTQMTERHSVWALLYTTCDGAPRMTIGPDSKIRPVATPGWAPESAQALTNRIKPIHTEIFSELTVLNHTVLDVAPMSPDPTDQNAARLASKLANSLARRPDFLRERNDAIDWSIRTGTFPMTVQWDPRAFATTTTNGSDRIYKRIGDVCFETVEPFNILLSPGVRSVEESAHVIISKYRTLTWMESHYPSHIPHLRAESGSWENQYHGRGRPGWRPYNWRNEFTGVPISPSNFGRQTTSPSFDEWVGHDSSEDYDGQPFLVHECYEKMEDEALGEFYWRTVICQDRMLEDGPWVPTIGEGKDRKALLIDGKLQAYPIPLVLGQYYRNPDDVWGRSPVKEMIGLVRFLWNLDLAVAVQSHNASQIMVAIRDGDVIDQARNKGMTEMRYRIDPPAILNMPGISPNMINNIMYYEEAIHRAVGRPALLQGRVSPDQSGKALQQAAGLASGAFEAVRRNHNMALSEVFTKAMRICGMMMDQPRLMALDSINTTGARYFRGLDFRGHTNVQCKLELPLGMTREQRIAMVRQDVQLGMLPPETYQKVLGADMLSEDLRTTVDFELEYARTYIERLKDIPPAIALQAFAMCMDAAKQKRDDYMANQQELNMPPNEMMAQIAFDDGKAEAMALIGIGVPEFLNPIALSKTLKDTLLQAYTQTLPPPVQSLMGLVLGVANHLATRNQMVQQVAQQQRLEATQQMAATQGQGGAPVQ